MKKTLNGIFIWALLIVGSVVAGNMLGSYLRSNNLNVPGSSCVGVCITDKSHLAVVLPKPGSGYNGNTVFWLFYEKPSTVRLAEEMAANLHEVRRVAKKGDIVVIHVDSPGGAVTSCSHTYHQIMQARSDGLRVYSVTDYMSASCGYLVSSATQRVYAAPGALMGNVGAILHVKTSNGLANPAIGEGRPLGSTRIKELLAGDIVRTPADIEFLRGSVLKNYAEFKKLVLISRGDVIKDQGKAFDGNLYFGQEALKLGLVDDLKDSRQVAKSLASQGYRIKFVSWIQ